MWQFLRLRGLSSRGLDIQCVGSMAVGRRNVVRLESGIQPCDCPRHHHDTAHHWSRCGRFLWHVVGDISVPLTSEVDGVEAVDGDGNVVDVLFETPGNEFGFAMPSAMLVVRRTPQWSLRSLHLQMRRCQRVPTWDIAMAPFNCSDHLKLSILEVVMSHRASANIAWGQTRMPVSRSVLTCLAMAR